MALIDQGVKMAAEADEPLEKNFVRKHSLEQAKAQGTTLREAACRVFSNASGSYSSNVNLAVENSTGKKRMNYKKCTYQESHLHLMLTIQER